MTYAPPGRFEIGRVLTRMTGVISRNLPVFAVLSLTLAGIPALAAAIVERGVFAGLGVPTSSDFGLGVVFSGLAGVVLQAALIHGTISDLMGRPVSLGECLNTALRHLLPLIGIAICSGIVTVLGFLFFVIPGVILSLALCVSAPVRVVEGLGVFASLGRSGDLTRNHRGALLLLFILYFVGAAVVGGLVSAVPLLAVIASPGISLFVRQLVVAPLVQTAGSLVSAAGVASIYFELRTAKEGAGIEELAAAFD